MGEEPVGSITDAELSGIVQELKREFPETMLWGQLRAMGLMLLEVECVLHYGRLILYTLH